MFTPLTLPNGSILPNRLAKAAMEENMAESGQLPGLTLQRLYQSWADGGAGLIITGNVMIDGRAMTGPGGWCLRKIRRWNRSGRGQKSHAKTGLRFGCKSITRVAR